MLKKLVVKTVVAALIMAGIFTSYGWQETSASATLRQVVDHTHPLYTVGRYYNDAGTVTQLWNAIPAEMKPYSAVVIIPGDHLNDTAANRAWITAELQECQNNNIPVLLQAMNGETKNSLALPVSWLDSLMQQYSVLIGFNAAELYNSISWYGATEGNHSQYIADVLNMVSNYGGYFYWTDTNVFGTNGTMMDWIQNNANLITAMRNHKENVIISYKESYTESSTEGLALGLFLAGLAGNWGISSDWWRWELNGNEEVFGSVHSGDSAWQQTLSYPEAMYGMDLVRSVSEGATVFNFEGGYYSTANNGRQTPILTSIVQPLFEKLLDGTIHIPSRQEVLDKNQFAYIGKPAWSVPYISGLSGLSMNTGRYGIIPLLPTNVNATEKANFEHTSSTAVTEAYLQSLYPLETIATNTFASRNGNTWYWMNSSDNSNVYQRSALIPHTNPSSYFYIGSNPHTYATITESSDQFNIHLNNYRVDKSAIYTGTAWGRTEVDQYLYNTYSVNPADDTLRTTIIKVNGQYNGQQPQLTIQGTNGYTYSEQWIPSTKEYTVTIRHNGPIDMRILANQAGSGTGSVNPPTNDIPQSQMTATASSQHTGYDANKALDGDSSSLWHTEWSPLANLPQSITLNLDGTYTIDKLRYLPRQDSSSSNGVITAYTISTSTDGVNFTTPTAGTWANDRTEKTVSFAPVSAAYVKLTATSGQGGYASAAEINVEKVTDNLALTATASASSQYNATFAPTKSKDGNVTTSWAPQSGTGVNEWLQMDFGAVKTINHISINETLNRTAGYKIQYYNGVNWIDLALGTTIPSSVSLTFAPITTQKVRLFITATQLDSNGWGREPNITEFSIANL